MPMLDDAIQAIRMGDKDEGRRLLEEILESDESNEDVWLWLTTVVDTDEDREVCLENVLALNANNAQAWLRAAKKTGPISTRKPMASRRWQRPATGSPPIRWGSAAY